MSDSTSPIKYQQAALLQQPMAFVQHRVQAGETLMGIALRYQTSVEYLKRINKLWSNDALCLREHLLVPSQEAPKDRVTRLVMEDEVNGTFSSPTLEASCIQLLPESLNAITLHSKEEVHGNATSNNQSPAAADTSIHEYLGSIDSQIEEAKTRAEELQKTSDVLKDHPEFSSNHHSWSKGHQPHSSSPSSRLRLSLTDLGAEFNAATNSPELVPSTAVVGTGSSRNKSKSFFNSKGTSRDEIFEL